MGPLLAIDWGTSTLRGALLDAGGAVQASRTFPRGVLSVAPGQHLAVLDTHFGDWRRLDGSRSLVCGMAGSRQGWAEAAYCDVPCGVEALMAQLLWVEPGRTAIVPGVRCEPDAVPDVMRGEETQVLGALQRFGRADTWVVLPGTHSKWVQVRGALIVGFTTFMTGEVFALLREHSILARSLPDAPDEYQACAFDAGVNRALAGGGLLHLAFGVRSSALFDRTAPGERLSYLSGLLIGEEMRHRPRDAVGPVALVGAPGLTQRYARALALCGLDAECIGEEAAWQGLHAIARRLWA